MKPRIDSGNIINIIINYTISIMIKFLNRSSKYILYSYLYRYLSFQFSTFANKRMIWRNKIIINKMHEGRINRFYP